MLVIGIFVGWGLFEAAGVQGRRDNNNHLLHNHTDRILHQYERIIPSPTTSYNTQTDLSAEGINYERGGYNYTSQSDSGMMLLRVV